MNKRLKFGLAAAGISLTALMLILLVPPSGVRMRLVGASGSPTQWTQIDHIRLLPTTTFPTITFSASGTTVTAEVGQTWNQIKVAVLLNENLAGSFSAAVAMTRVHVKIVAPNASTLYENYLPSSDYWGWQPQYDGSWHVIWFNNGTEWGAGYTLVEGTYTITTKYEIYV